MALTETSGILAVTGTLADLFSSQTTLKFYATTIFFHNLLSGDSIEITIHIKDVNDTVERIYDQFTVSNVQPKPATFIPFLPTGSYRITARTVAGVDRSITWTRHET